MTGRRATIRDQGQTLSQISAATGLSYHTLLVRYRRGLRGAKLRGKTRGGTATVRINLAVAELQTWEWARAQCERDHGRPVSLADLVRADMADLVAGLRKKSAG